jgi:hypothetical protein
MIHGNLLPRFRVTDYMLLKESCYETASDERARPTRPLRKLSTSAIVVISASGASMDKSVFSSRV